MSLFRKNKRFRRKGLGNRKRKLLKLKLIFSGVFLVILISLFAWVIRIDDIEIQEVTIAGNNITKTKDIQKYIDRHLNGTYLLVVPKKSIFFYPRAKIRRDILDELTRIYDVNIKREGFNAIAVDIKERIPFSLWCGKEIEVSENDSNKCYFMDKESFIFAESPDFTGNVFFKYFGIPEIGSSSSDPRGAQFMDEGSFNGMRLFIDSFEDIDLTPIALIVRNVDRDYELILEDGGKIIFGREDKLSVVFDNLKSIIESDAFESDKDKKLDYIELRFGNKAYYKIVE